MPEPATPPAASTVTPPAPGTQPPRGPWRRRLIGLGLLAVAAGLLSYYFLVERKEAADLALKVEGAAKIAPASPQEREGAERVLKDQLEAHRKATNRRELILLISYGATLGATLWFWIGGFFARRRAAASPGAGAGAAAGAGGPSAAARTV